MQWNQFQEWIFDQCCKNGSVELTKQQLERCFPGDPVKELANLTGLCDRKGMKLSIDHEKKTFTFELIEPDLRGF